MKPKHKDSHLRVIPHSKPTVGRKETAAVAKCIQAAQITQGDAVVRFEQMFAERMGVKYAAAVNSGTSALHLVLLAFGIGANDEVIIPSFVCTALLNAIRYTGATPVPADIDPSTFNLDIQDVKRRLTSRVKAVIVPHMFGLPVDINTFRSLGLPIIEDCAQAVGSTFQDKPVGTFGHAAVFSFYTTKMMTTGEGGMVVSGSQRIVNRVKDFREYDRQKSGKLRYNYKMTDFQAAMGHCQLARLATFIQKRNAIAARYDRALAKVNLSCPVQQPGRIYYRYVVHTAGAQRHIDKMKSLGIICAKPVYRPIHRYLGLSGFNQTENAWRKALSLPIYPLLTNVQVNYVIRALTEVCGKNASE